MAKEKELEQVEGQQLSVENKVESLIRVIRGQQVMLDRDLAELYGVETKRLNEQVKRNIERFPEDFMFQLTPNEFDNLKSQFATSSWGGVRKLPYAFTEQGVAMLSGVLKSPTAVEANRSEERRVGKECVTECRSRWSPSHSKNNFHDVKPRILR